MDMRRGVLSNLLSSSTVADDVIDGVPRRLIDVGRAARISGQQALQYHVAAFLRCQQLRSLARFGRQGMIYLASRGAEEAGASHRH